MAVDQTLAGLSNQLVYSAMLVYTGALGAYALDLANRGAQLAIQEPERVAAGGVPASADDAPGPDGERPAPSAASSRAGGIAVSLTWLAFVLHLGAVVARGLSVQRAPWGNMYEFSISGALVVTGVFLAVLWRRDIRYLGLFVVGPVLLTLGLAVSVLYTQAAQLVPALQSFWLLIHVSVAFIASALFTLGFSSTVLQLVQERRETARASGRVDGGVDRDVDGGAASGVQGGADGARRTRARLLSGAFMDALPPAVELERSSYRLHVVAFPLWTFTVMAGAIWAEHAWGRYWGWDPKEVWSFVIWVVYAAYLHARATRGWDGRRAAYLALAGYGCILFNFLVVNIFFVGWHSYAGVG